MAVLGYLPKWKTGLGLDLSSNNLERNCWQGEKEGKTEIQKLEYLKNEKSFLDEIKNIFIKKTFLSFDWK